jgi:hypothetical protein
VFCNVGGVGGNCGVGVGVRTCGPESMIGKSPGTCLTNR